MNLIHVAPLCLGHPLSLAQITSQNKFSNSGFTY